ncbi:uncharacterized protein LOC135834779 [Planococcus citri]|uniref:uncharacterized protein LOC135834779 n=1 Tax=Planococcus citri TaxID=170843 RepID=UPI0031F88DD1
MGYRNVTNSSSIKHGYGFTNTFGMSKKLVFVVIFIAAELGLLNANTNHSDSITESTLYNFSEFSTTAEIRRNRLYREWRRGDPSVHKSMWNSKAPLGKAQLYIILALLIGFCTVVIGCWLSDNCWSPEPEHVVMIA